MGEQGEFFRGGIFTVNGGQDARAPAIKRRLAYILVERYPLPGNFFNHQ